MQNLLIRELSQWQCRGLVVGGMEVHGKGDFKRLGQFLQAREKCYCHQQQGIIGHPTGGTKDGGGEEHWKECSLSFWTL